MRRRRSFSIAATRACDRRFGERRGRELIGEVFDYIEAFYNTTRRHSTLGYFSPAQFELRASRSDIKTMRLETQTT